MSRCGGCKEVWYCSLQCQRDDWKGHKARCGRGVGKKDKTRQEKDALPVFEDDVASSIMLCAYVQKKGFALVKVQGIGALTAKAVSWARRFFVLPFEAKRGHGAGPGVGQQHGYMDLTWTETFECKDRHDPRFTWPHPDFERDCEALASSLRGVGLRVLQLLCEAAKLDWAKVQRDLLDCSSTPLESASHSALRILLYSKPATTTQANMGHIFGTGDHTDNSFVTVAPCATVKGLEILPFDAPQHGWINVEEEMTHPDVVCVFVGDSLNKITGGMFPSVIHRPNETACLRPLTNCTSDKERQAAGRISTPYFLRGRIDGLLETPGGAAEPITVAQLEVNHAQCREMWPWKRKHHEYYKLQQFSKVE